MGEVLTEKMLDRINFSDSFVCHYRYRIINTEEKDGKLWLVSQEYEKGILNPDHNFELNPIDPDIKKECDKVWTKEVVDSWINRQKNYSNMSPKERINAGYK